MRAIKLSLAGLVRIRCPFALFKSAIAVHNLSIFQLRLA